MSARRVKRLTTLDEFLMAAREAARAAREQRVDVEELIARIAEAAAKKAASMVSSNGLDEARLTRIVRNAVRDELNELLPRLLPMLIQSTLSTLIERIERLQQEVRELRERVARQGGHVQTQQLPSWARKVLDALSSSPFVRLHELGLDPQVVRSSTDVLRKLNVVVVETTRGVYLVKRDEWNSMLERLLSVKVRDEEAAIRAAGALAEVLVALIRDNMVYYNNGWRILSDAYFDPQSG